MYIRLQFRVQFIRNLLLLYYIFIFNAFIYKVMCVVIIF